MIDPNTGNPFAAQIPSAWSAYVPILTGMVRGFLQLAGGLGFMHAQTVTASQVEMGVSAAMAVSGMVWGAWQKIATQRALHKAATNPAGMAAPAVPS